MHISNIYNREDFRHKSLISKVAKGIICGFGLEGYIMALDAMKKNYLKMKIDKKLIKELVENLKEFNLTELEYQDGETKVKFQELLNQLNNHRKQVLLYLRIKTVLKKR